MRFQQTNEAQLFFMIRRTRDGSLATEAQLPMEDLQHLQCTLYK